MTGQLTEPMIDKGDNSEVGLSGALKIVAYINLSILSSVCVVMCNKEVFQHGFPFPLTLTFVASLFTWLYYRTLKATGVWVPQKDENGRDKSLPRIENIKVAFSSVCSIGFMNLCLLTNTVAIYQICKFATIPCTLCFQYFVFKQKTNSRVLSALVIILGGVGYSSFKGFEAGNLGVKGIIFAVFAVVSTSVFRIWQGTKQKEFNVGPVDFQATVSGWRAIFCLLAGLMLEFLPVEHEKTVMVWSRELHGFSPQLLVLSGWMLGVCVFALTVDFTSFGLIGKTGPVAYAVVGHAKTVLTIVIGIAMFPQQETAATIRADIIGCGTALFGVVAYTHFEYCFKNNLPDWVEKNIPSLVAKKVAPRAVERGGVP